MNIKALVIAVICLFGHALASMDVVEARARINGPEVPFPLSAALPFPWGTIEGVWEAKGPAMNALFSFEVQNDCDKRKVLRVLQLDPATREVMAEGTAIGVDQQRIVRAAMRGYSESYMLFVGAFNNKRGGVINVLTMRAFAGSSESDFQVVVKKISQTPIQIDEEN